MIVRAGTCGSINPNFRDGSILAVTAAVRSDGVTDYLVPKGYPAVADWRVVQAICNALQKATGIKYGEGIVVTEGKLTIHPSHSHSHSLLSLFLSLRKGASKSDLTTCDLLKDPFMEEFSKRRMSSGLEQVCLPWKWRYLFYS